MQRAWWVWWLPVHVLCGGVVAGAEDQLSLRVRNAVTKSVRLMDRTSATFLERRKCFSCHTQTFAAMVLTDAERAGLNTDAKNRRAQVQRAFEIYDVLGGVRPDTVGHALVTLAIGGQAPNAKTAAMVNYLLEYQPQIGHWQVAIENREPAEASHFATNYFVVRGISRYATAELQATIDFRRQAVQRWYATATAKDTEDQVFRLFLGQELGVPRKQLQAFARQLVAEQRASGGWAQRRDMQPDAYATATALVSLHRAGGMATNQLPWKQGLRFLLDRQQVDGSWYVKSRVEPVQAYFESGFPHGKHQFISAFATGWATEALLLSLLQEAKTPRNE